MESVTLYNGEIELRLGKWHRYEVREKVSGLFGKQAAPIFSEWRAIPSVTQILKVLDKSGPLTQWAANCAIDLLRESWHPGIAYDEGEINNALQSARFNFRAVKRAAADVGTQAHQWIEKLLREVVSGSATLDLAWDLPDLPENLQASRACEAAVKYLQSRSGKIVAIESRLYSRRYGYAGTMDGAIVVESAEGVEIEDWKSSKGIYDEMSLQLAAYAQAYTEMTGTLVTKRRIVRIGKDDGEFETREWGGELSDEEDFECFRSLITPSLWLRARDRERRQ